MEFLASIGATNTSHHAGRSLQDHLIATWQILSYWDCNEAVKVAGLCHSIYGTDAFDTACLGLADRPRVREKIGTEAENFAFLFGAIYREQFLENPASQYQSNRFDESDLLMDDPARFAISHILLANEIDLVIAKKGLGRPDKVQKKVGPIFDQISPFLSKTAIKAYKSLSTPA